MEDKFRAQELRLATEAWALWFPLAVTAMVATCVLTASSVGANGILLPSQTVFIVVLCCISLIKVWRPMGAHSVPLHTVSCAVVFAYMGWLLHALTQQYSQRVTEGDLRDVFQLLVSQAEPRAQLSAFVQREYSQRFWNQVLLFNYVALDLVRFLSWHWLAAVPFALLPISMYIAMLASGDVVDNVYDPPFFAILLPLYGAISSVRFLHLQRRFFIADYELYQGTVAEVQTAAKLVEQQVLEQEATLRADSALNHVLKNVMADAVGCIDLSWDKPPAAAQLHLQQAVACLARGMQWCTKRNAILRISQGQYPLSLESVNLREFGEMLVEGRPVVTAQFPAAQVKLDSTICSIVFEKALNNAIHHGDPTDPAVQFNIMVEPLLGCRTASHAEMCRVQFTISNRIDGSRPPITPDLVEKLISGEVRTHPIAPALCSALGLQHVYMAARVHNMQLSLTQTGDIVRFQAIVEAELEAGNVSDSATIDSVQEFPQGLTIFCLEDSDVARRLLQHALENGMVGCTVKAFGRTAEEVAQFMVEAKQAHILVMDQHLDYGHEAFLGTDLIRTLRSTGHDGFICMRSANMAREDRALYEESGVHCVIGKEVRAQRFVSTLKAAYMDHVKKETRVHKLIRRCSRQNSSACLPIVASYRAAVAANLTLQPHDIVAAFDSLADIAPSQPDLQLVSPSHESSHGVDSIASLPGAVCDSQSISPSPVRLLPFPIQPKSKEKYVTRS